MSEYVTREYLDAKIGELKVQISQLAPATLTVTQAAKLLNCTPITIYRLIDKGKIVATQVSARKKELTYKSVIALKK